MRARTRLSEQGAVGPSPSDQELVAFITKPMRSFDVARHFGMDGPACLIRLAKMVKDGKLGRPFYGFYAPVGASAPCPLPPLPAKILAVLGEPRTAAEASALIGVGYSVTRVLQMLMRCGHVVHCGRFHYVRAELAGQFGAPPSARPRSGHRTAKALREAVLGRLVEPCSVSRLALDLKETRERIAGQLAMLVRAGRVVRVGRIGNPPVFHFSLAKRGLGRFEAPVSSRQRASRSRARP